MINALSKQGIFLGDFNSKHKQFGCVKPNKSGQTLDMAFITPGLSSRDISFSVADDHMGSDHFPIQISLDKPLKRNTPLTEPRYRFDKTNDDLPHNTLKDSLTSIDTITRYDLSAAILFKVADSYLVAFKFVQ